MIPRAHRVLGTHQSCDSGKGPIHFDTKWFRAINNAWLLVSNHGLFLIIITLDVYITNQDWPIILGWVMTTPGKSCDVSSALWQSHGSDGSSCIGISTFAFREDCWMFHVVFREGVSSCSKNSLEGNEAVLYKKVTWMIETFDCDVLITQLVQKGANVWLPTVSCVVSF